ncbi:MAG TPA: acyltransferase family protein [Candidatus Limnocylindrales bacterium]|nr:acyltransferase family protein [Candidatus Limnocylindrales bacterium]
MSGTLTRQRRAVRRPALPHLVGLDGLRAVAVIAVVLYHADVAWIPGGFLGVDVFFVLSGFLITSLLLVELDRTGGLDFKNFYVRRARRLLPALFAVLGVTALLVATVAYDGAAAFRRDLPGALFYYSNWLSILTETSYFEFIGRPPMLKHLWSLAVEEQFYIFWPAIALFAYRWRGARAVGLVALGGALLSTLAMTLGSFLGDMPGAADPSRLYFGTDTHAMGVFIGAALAVVWRPGRTSPVLPRQARLVITGAGVAALVLLVAMFTMLGEFSTFLYRGGFLVVALVSAVVVAAASHRGTPFGRWLGMRPMRWVGERSYGIYLWHWPLFLVTRPGADIPVDGALALVLRVTLLLGIAELSYRYVEMPVRRGALARAWQRVRDGELPQPSPALLAAVAAVAILVMFTGFRVVTAPAPASAAGMTAEQYAALAPARAPLERDFARIAAAEELDPRAKVTAFGDSVMLGASGALESDTFNVDLHAKVATQATDVLDAITSQVSSGQLRDTVILHVGNNGIVTEEQLRGMLAALSGAQKVVLVNVRVPRPWMKPNNELISSVAPDYPNVTVADWAKASEENRDYMVKDGVHLTSAGAEVYTRIIAEAAGVEPT